MKRGRPIHAQGGGARKDHLFEEDRSLCGSYLWGGGRDVNPDEMENDEDELCQRCARKAGVA